MRYSKNKSFGVFFLIFGPLILIGSIILFSQKVWPNYLTAKASKSWPSAQGEIKNSYLDSNTTGSGKKKKTNYRAEISYSYEVSGKTYRGNELFIGSSNTWGSKSSANATLRKYPIGKNIEVFYSKESPAPSVLEPGAHLTHYIWIGSTIIFGLVGLCATLTMLFKITVVTAVLGSIIGGLFKKKSVKEVSKAVRGHEPIDLDDEMAAMNQVSASSSSGLAQDAPWNHKWIIKSSKSAKNYGPYEYKQVMRFFEEGKIKGFHKCYPEGGGNEVRVDYIAVKTGSKAA